MGRPTETEEGYLVRKESGAAGKTLDYRETFFVLFLSALGAFVASLFVQETMKMKKLRGKMRDVRFRT